jgi:predicted nucleic acid-binding protein
LDSKWCIDTNTLVPWLIKATDLLGLLERKYNLSKEFTEVYLERHQHSITFIDTFFTLKANGLDDDCYCSYLAMNEIYSAMRDEVRSIVLLKNGVPLSRWVEERNTLQFPDECAEIFFKKVDELFLKLFETGSIIPLSDEPEENNDHYSEIIASLIFNFKRVKTQDAILLATAISIQAKYFVTFDVRLIEELKDSLLETYDLRLITPKEANHVLNIQKKRMKLH